MFLSLVAAIADPQPAFVLFVRDGLAAVGHERRQRLGEVPGHLHNPRSAGLRGLAGTDAPLPHAEIIRAGPAQSEPVFGLDAAVPGTLERECFRAALAGCLSIVGHLRYSVIVMVEGSPH